MMRVWKGMALAAGLALTPVSAHAGVFTSNFEAVAALSGSTDPFTDLSDVPDGLAGFVETFFTPTDLQGLGIDDFVSAGPFSVIGAAALTVFDIDLPAPDELATFTVDVSLTAEGTAGFAGAGAIPLSIDESLTIPSLGPVTSNDILGAFGAGPFAADGDIESFLTGAFVSFILGADPAVIQPEGVYALGTFTVPPNGPVLGVVGGVIDDFLSFSEIAAGLGDILGDPSLATLTTLDITAATLSITVTAVTVPEPASLALFGLGLAGAAIVRRRRAL